MSIIAEDVPQTGVFCGSLLFFVPFEDSFPYYNTDVRGLSRMRMRKKKNLDVRFAACADVMAFEPKEKRGKWRALFGNDNPIHLEIGCGKGRFAIGMAEQHPDVNFIAVEREEGALIMAAERCQQQPLPRSAVCILRRG